MKSVLMIVAAVVFAASGVAADTSRNTPAPPPNPVRLEANGTVHVPPMDIPVSEYLSPQGKAYMAQHLNQMQHPELLVQHNGIPAFLAGYLERQRALFPVARQDTTIAGVHAYVYTPKSGVAPRNAQRVLIDLHGGGFHECWPACAELESIPISFLAQMKVISLDYRQGPKYQFPAASEDVAAVYKELLKSYRPEAIGIYGCSAGGILTGMSVAWFQKHGLPKPGAVGLLCAGLTMSAGFGGDANYLAMPVGEGRMPFPPPKPTAPGQPPRSPMSYLANADMNDPLVSPAVSLPVLAKFPPTLIVAATRGFEYSSAVYTHSRLVKAGADAELHVWEGLFHGFFYNPDVPESRDCYDVIVKFFDKHLAK